MDVSSKIKPTPTSPAPSRPRPARRPPRRAAAAPGTPPAGEVFDSGAPAWVAELLGPTARREAKGLAGALHESVTAGERFTLVSVRVAGAADLNPPAFELATAEAYAVIARRIEGACDPAARHPVRFWNYIPGIHQPSGAGLDRYMVFNAGRFAACSDWLGGPEAFDRLLATASGVGHRGPDLVIHALAADAPGIAVENPRQVPPYRYSRRFGPRPPCFARATVLNANRQPGGSGRAGRLILIGGTASIRGEESMHVGDLRGQCLETFENLDALVRHAAAAGLAPEDAGRASAVGLNDFRDLRVYHPRRGDDATIAPLVTAAFPNLRRVEYVQADLCREELLVEIEGVAEVG